MPIYEYQCQRCAQRIERLQKFSDAPLTRCPTCGEDALNKLISAAAFHLKGTGWYATDFKDKKQEPTPPDTENSKTAKKDTQATPPSTRSQTKTDKQTASQKAQTPSKTKEKDSHD